MKKRENDSKPIWILIGLIKCLPTVLSSQQYFIQWTSDNMVTDYSFFLVSVFIFTENGHINENDRVYVNVYYKII